MVTPREFLPAELREGNFFVCWKYEQREGKLTKPPVNPHTGGLASSTNPADWAPYPLALDAVDAHRCEGIGRVVTADQGLVGIDLDHCRNKQTGQLDAHAASIVRRLRSYTEITPSGEGVRIWVRGKKPGGRCRKEGVEIYDRNRYFTLTGEHVRGTPRTVESRQAELDSLCRELFPENKSSTHDDDGAGNPIADEELIPRMFASKNGQEILALWEGSTAAYADDDSRADAALCAHLAFWTGKNAERMDRLFRQSKLMRPKWDTRRGASTYGADTIAHAIEFQSDDVYTPGPAPPKPAPAPKNFLKAVSVPELIQLDVPEREMILDPFLPTQGLAMLYSKRGVGKTFISLGISLAVAIGSRFLRWTAPVPRRVLYVDGEMPLSALKQRVMDIGAGFDLPLPPENLKIITPDLQNERGLPDLSTICGQDEIEEHLEGVNLLVLDNLSALVRAVKENEGEGWLPVQDWALGLRRRGIAVLFVHHAGKDKNQRGTSRREDLLDSVVTLKHPSDYNPSEGLRCIVEYEKSRGFYGDAAKSFDVRMSAGPSGETLWTVSDPEVSIESRALQFFRDGMSVRDVADELGISKSRAHRLKNGLRGMETRPERYN